jgi:hypothetical protein
MEARLWKKIPVDIFINHIAPYCYEKIDDVLLNDIRNFIRDYRMIINYYYLDMNEYCLLVDLIWFCNKKLLFEVISRSFMNILNRNIIFNSLSMRKKYEYIQQKFYYYNSSNTAEKNKFILGLLTPSERTQFINEYIIEYYP